MMEKDAANPPQEPLRVSAEPLETFCLAALDATGADEATCRAATDAMMHGSRHGVDSHGVRLLDHYVRALEGGRLNKRPVIRVAQAFGAIKTLDADHAHGALAAYEGMRQAIELAAQFGIAAVAIRNSSHFGPAGAFAMEAAKAGYIGLAFCNSDSFVRLHGGASRFHGTNPIACAVPVAGSRPWLLDMATSAIPYNRVQLYKSLGRPLPEGTASDVQGNDVTDPGIADMLAPLGAAFGFKGAALAGMAEIFSAVLSGAKLSPELAPMGGPDFATPRNVGAFVMAIKPDAFLSEEEFHDGMTRYLQALRGSPARAGERVMAPGDREWAEAEARERYGIPIDPTTEAAFRTIAERFGIALPFA
ncbi:Ldh family oxidoreductase [Rhizobium sp. RU36D]|uniref:Ldh family oxidoreductase n=1 Tax=Rhizobium sp. RU36D TaxID=1907415 RepID=UPI0009D7C4A7|nr:Ldh family oxidoreductase [Rhizobium sp. RU36D]SMC52303.1 Malate/lactate/ureidoglycolate dehydrogenase, LDH2 family [Rhizobium sp. RU36D]